MEHIHFDARLICDEIAALKETPPNFLKTSKLEKIVWAVELLCKKGTAVVAAEEGSCLPSAVRFDSWSESLLFSHEPKMKSIIKQSIIL